MARGKAGKRPQRNKRILMKKGRPKLSKEQEEHAAFELFDQSIPGQSRGDRVQKVVDEEDARSVDTQSDSDSSSSDTGEPSALNQLMTELGADRSSDLHSDDDGSSIDGSPESSEEEEDGPLNDDDDLLEDDESDYDEEDSDQFLSDGGNAEGGAGNKKIGRKRVHSSDEDADEIESGDEVSSSDSDMSGSADELSLADSSYSEPETPITSSKAKQTKKVKPLDLAVDPDDLLDSDHKITTKQRVEIKETIKSSDPFVAHFETDMGDKDVSAVCAKADWVKQQTEVTGIGKLIFCHAKTCPSFTPMSDNTTLPSLGVRGRLCNQLEKAMRNHCENDPEAPDPEEGKLSHTQRQIFSILNNYQDLYYPCQKWSDMERIRLTYCLHSLNHILKTRLRVTLNSEDKWSQPAKSRDPDKEYRDQGLTRPKVLILAPFKESARRIVNMFESLLMSKKKSFVSNKKRFLEQFTLDEETAMDPRKPDDYLRMFEGNTDDCFRVGIKLSKAGMKLYADFYKADILVCSPLGLRLILGADGDKSRDYDFMSSIELLILDQADVFLMQNWDHVLLTMGLLHVQPKKSRDTDFSRVRMWALDGHSKHYRQTVVLSSVHSPELSALFSKHCANRAGEVRVQPAETAGSICQIITQIPQIFQKFPVTSPGSLADERFQFFIKEILPQYRVKERMGTMIYVPSYYDYVRLRNYFKKESIDTSLLCEYTGEKAIRRAKTRFYTKETHFLLYTERVHFFKRMYLKKVRHLIFYSLPTYPHFFSDVCNMYRGSQQADASCLVLFSKLEAYKLAACVGNDRARHMVTADKSVFMFVTGEESR